jgi:UDP-3-O-[3-hydroxymyristoyl] N-acetylglucosamine deacetylase
MGLSIYQQTISKQITFHGVGIHTGKFCEVTLNPLKEDQGIVFHVDGIAKKYVAENVQGDSRGSQLIISDTQKIMTIEHLISAIAGLGIDNILIDVEGPEIPIKNGSPSFFVEQLLAAEPIKQHKQKKFFRLKEKQLLIDEKKEKAILALPAETFKVAFLIDYPDPIVKTDIAHFDLVKEDYAKELGEARTYGFENEVAYLQEKGLAQGATLNNAIVVSPSGYSVPLHYPNELARHKIVDFIGDIMALGALPLAHFIAVKSGHAFNHNFVQRLLYK